MTVKPVRARTTRSVNLHLAPGSEKLIDAVPPDTVVEIIEKRQQPKFLWAFVFVPSRNEHGWCRDDFLAVEENVVPLPSHPPPLDPGPVDVPRDTPVPLPPSRGVSGPWFWAAALVIALIVAALFAL